MKAKLHYLAALILLGCFAVTGCSEDSDDTATTGGATATDSTDGGETISYSGEAVDYIAGTPGAGFTVCLHESETCTTTDDEGKFTLAGLPKNSEVLFTFTADDGSAVAFPITTADEDMTGAARFSTVTRQVADLLIKLGGAEEGFDTTKS